MEQIMETWTADGTEKFSFGFIPHRSPKYIDVPLRETKNFSQIVASDDETTLVVVMGRCGYQWCPRLVMRLKAGAVYSRSTDLYWDRVEVGDHTFTGKSVQQPSFTVGGHRYEDGPWRTVVAEYMCYDD